MFDSSFLDISFLSALLTLVPLFVWPFSYAAFSATTDGPNYDNEENWIYCETHRQLVKPVDCFLVCPTVDLGWHKNLNANMEDPKIRDYFLGALNMERGIYDNVGAMFSPLYRQVAFPVYSMSPTRTEYHKGIGFSDLRRAFRIYLNKYNNGRPIIMAGFSQGADMMLRLLKEPEFYNDPRLKNNFVAAYAIGWRLTKADTARYPLLRPAQGELDSGVVIAMNTESVETESSLLVPKGVRTMNINPLNWKTDSTVADDSQNLGFVSTDKHAKIKKVLKGVGRVYIDEKRGTLKLPDLNPADFKTKMFPDGVFHLYDYKFFYRNLQQNVIKRTYQYLLNHKI